MEGKTPIPEKEHLGKLATTTPTMCIFLSIDKIDEVVKILIPHYGKDCPVAVVYKATWPDQKIVCSKLIDIAEKVKQESIKSQHSSLSDGYLKRSLKDLYYILRIGKKAKNHQYS